MRRNKKITIFTILIILMLPFSLVLLATGIKKTSMDIVGYREQSSINYKVCLKENEFYEEKCQEQGMGYIASAIEYIDINLDYSFFLTNKLNHNYEYYIDGIVTVVDKNDSANVLFTKKVELTSLKKLNLNDSDSFSIGEKLIIDYAEYNDLVKSFRNTFNVSIESNLKIVLGVRSVSRYGEYEKTIDTNSTMEMTIPLTENTIKINMNHKETNSEDEVTFGKNEMKINYLNILIGLTSLLVSLLLVIKVIRILIRRQKNKTGYEKFIEQKLKNYNRMVVSAKESIKIEEKNYIEIIDVEDFEELVDIADRLLKLIVWTEVEHSNKLIVSWFTIEDGKRLYRTIYKSTDENFK